jgi:hypothetical protein
LGCGFEGLRDDPWRLAKPKRAIIREVLIILIRGLINSPYGAVTLQAVTIHY